MKLPRSGSKRRRKKRSSRLKMNDLNASASKRKLLSKPRASVSSRSARRRRKRPRNAQPKTNRS